MAAVKEKPPERPTFDSLWRAAAKKEQYQLSDIKSHFQRGLFFGKLVAAWCRYCGAWRYCFVSPEREKVIAAGADNKFLCPKCDEGLVLVVNEFHTLLNNMTGKQEA